MKNKKVIMITGIRGQDGSTLADLYLKTGKYKVIGIDRWSAVGGNQNIQDALKNPDFIVETGDITDYYFIHRILQKYKPFIIYNLAAISFVPESFGIPTTVFNINTLAVVNMLEEIKNNYPKTRFYQASTSEQIGMNREIPQNENSKMIPNSPYAIAKLASFHTVRLYRNAYNLFCSNGLLWNHEGPRRGPDFVTRKISKSVAKIFYGKQQVLELGNLDAKRDWGFSKDYCEAMMLMMHSDKPDDYAVSTGEMHSIREFVERAFAFINLKITWRGKGLKEVGIDKKGIVRVRINPKFYRPAEVQQLCGDSSKIRNNLGWKPTTTFNELVDMMVANDLKLEEG